jgi:hypothetical protein
MPVQPSLLNVPFGYQFDNNNIQRSAPSLLNTGVSPIKILDTRRIDSITGKPISSNVNLTRNADPEVVKKIVRSAKINGVDPYLALSVAHQETGLAPMGDTEWNPFHLIDNRGNDLIDSGVKMIKNGMLRAKNIGKTDEAHQIQSFNGYGRVGVNTEGKHKSFYGIDVSKHPIDMNINPVYGKRIIDIRDNILKKNKAISDIIKNTK